MKRITTTAAFCGSLLGLALVLPAQAQNYPYTPGAGPESNSSPIGTVIIVERPVVTITESRPESATSRDAEGRPTHGAFGTGDQDSEIAMTREERRYPVSPRRAGRY